MHSDNKISTFSIAAAVLFGLLLFTHVIPTAMGLSFWPTPIGLYAQANSTRLPAFHTGAEYYTFPHLEWPWRIVERDFLMAGDLPLWSPYTSLGVPLGAQYENQLFLPIEWIEIFGGPRLWSILLIAKIFLAGIGSMLLVRRFCVTAPALVAGALFYAYSSYFLWFGSIPAFVNEALGLPWLFIAIVNLFDETIAVARKIGQLALTVGFICLSGQPQIAALSLASAAVIFSWAWFHAVSTRRRPTGAILIAICGGILGVMIAAPQLWSFTEALNKAYSIHMAGAYSDPTSSYLNFTIPVWPHLFGQLMQPWDARLNPEHLNWEAFPFLVGTSGFLLCVLGVLTLTTTRQEKNSNAFLLYGAVTIIVIFFAVIFCGTFGWSVWKGPGVNRINFSRYIGPILSICAACLAAWSVENLRYASLRHLVATGAIFIGFAALAAIVVWPIATDPNASIDTEYFYASLALGIVPSVLVLFTWITIIIISTRFSVGPERLAWAIVTIAIGEFTFFVRLGFGLECELARLAPLTAVCIVAIAIVLHQKRIAALGLAAALAAAVSILVLSPYRLAPFYDPYAAPPNHITFLKTVAGTQEGSPRILARSTLMIPNVANGFGLSDVAGLSPLQIDRSARMILALLSPRQLSYITPNGWNGISTRNGIFPSWNDYFARRSIYNAFSVAYLVDAPDGYLSSLNDGSLDRVYSDKNAVIYRDRRALPRAYLIDAARPIANLENVFSAMLDPSFDPWNEALVEVTPGLLPATMVSRKRGNLTALTIAKMASTSVEIVLDGKRGLAVLTDAIYPGWTAKVDGQSRDIYVVNGAFRGVLIEAGDKKLSFSYTPNGFIEVLVLAVLAFITSIGLLFLPHKVRDKAQA